MEAIKTIGLTKKYKDLVAVDGLELEIFQGELFALLGVNGAGKTTTIKMLTGLTQPTEGDALIGGFSITKEPLDAKRLLGVSPQETAVAPNLTVQENLALMGSIYGLPKEIVREKVHTLAEQFGMIEILNKRAGKLSGGWQRRLSIAMALIGEPRVLFLDEPTLGLDVLARSELWDMIRSLKGKVTIVLTTHYMEEAQALSDRIGIMQKGRLLITRTAEELMTLTNTDSVENAFISIVKGAQK